MKRRQRKLERRQHKKITETAVANYHEDLEKEDYTILFDDQRRPYEAEDPEAYFAYDDYEDEDYEDWSDEEEDDYYGLGCDAYIDEYADTDPYDLSCNYGNYPEDYDIDPTSADYKAGWEDGYNSAKEEMRNTREQTIREEKYGEGLSLYDVLLRYAPELERR